MLYGSSDGLGWFLLAGLALYSVGAHAGLRAALRGVGLYAAWSVLLVLRDPHAGSSEVVARSLLYSACLLPTWGVGVLVRNPRLRAIEWERRASRLERERAQAEREAVQRERSHISRELHDIVGHSVSVIVLKAQAGDSRLESEPGATRRTLHAIEDSARQAMSELCRLLTLLQDADQATDLGPQPRLEGIPSLVEGVRRAGLTGTLEVRGQPALLAPGLELNASRIIQEALTNSLKHARATQV